jgi:hypothetical protein
VFVTWSKTRRPRPALDPGSPAQASLPTEPFSLARSPTGLPNDNPEDRPSFNLSSLTEVKTVRYSAALLGSATLASRFAFPHRNASSRVALEKTDSSGASYRLAPLPLRRASTLPAGGDRIFGPAALFLPLPAFRVRPEPPSRSPDHHAHPVRVAKAKNLGTSLWIMGISGTTLGTFAPRESEASTRLPFRSPPLTSDKCLNRLPPRPSPPICTD